jgi:FkbM family methyltransferase
MIAFVRDSVRSALKSVGYDLVNLKKDENTSRFLPHHLRRHFSRQRINCVIDVGANRGQYASMLRSSGYAGRIVSIEPLPELCAELRRLADPEWRVINVALGDEEEVLPFNVFAATDLSSFLRPKADIESIVPHAQLKGVASIRVTELDRLVPEVTEGIAEPRIFLKLDTQGFDLRVLKGAGQTLAHVFLMQSEISIIPLYEDMPTYFEALTAFHALGFIPSGFFSVYEEQQSGINVDYDVVLTRATARWGSP